MSDLKTGFILPAGEECHCGCHFTNTMQHNFPCCYYCPDCGVRINTSVFVDHERRHKEGEKVLSPEMAERIKEKQQWLEKRIGFIP